MIQESRKFRNRYGGVKIAEFGSALFIFFFLLMFPLINLIGFAMGAGTLYLLTVQAATVAGNQSTYGAALTAMQTVCNTMAASGFGQFAKLQPVAGYSGCGANLYTVVTPVAGGGSTQFGPNSPYVAVIDNSAYIYEYEVRTLYDIGPFLNLSAVPFIGDVPAIGRPARLSFVAHRTVEFTEGLALGGTGVGAGGGLPPGGAGGASAVGSVSLIAGAGSAGAGGLIVRGRYYSPFELTWFSAPGHSSEPVWINYLTHETVQNPFETLGDPTTLADGVPNPFYHP